MTHKTETASGRLLTFFGEWKVQTGYGTFPLSQELQAKPDKDSQAAWVSCIVSHGVVVDYHFSPEPL